MISRAILLGLVAVLIVLTVAMAVVSGFALLLGTLGDRAAAGVLQAIAGGCGIVLVIDLVLLVGALAVRSLETRDGP